MSLWGGGVSSREQRSRARSRHGGVSENRIVGSAAARLFFLTAVAIAVAIAIATRPFKFHEILVSYTSSSFVSSIHSLGYHYVVGEDQGQNLPGQGTHLSGTTVGVDKTKERMYLDQALRVPHLSGTVVVVESLGARAIPIVRCHCRGEEGKGTRLTLPRP